MSTSVSVIFYSRVKQTERTSPNIFQRRTKKVRLIGLPSGSECFINTIYTDVRGFTYIYIHSPNVKFDSEKTINRLESLEFLLLFGPLFLFSRNGQGLLCYCITDTGQ